MFDKCHFEAYLIMFSEMDHFNNTSSMFNKPRCMIENNMYLVCRNEHNF